MNIKFKRTLTPLFIAALAMFAVFTFGCGPTPAGNSANVTNVNSNTAKTTGTPAPVNAPVGAPLTTNVLGSPTAAVTVEEFADYQCPACGSAYPTMKEIQSAYGDRIKFIFRNYPLAIPAHDKAYKAALAAEAAAMQGKFWAMQDLLFTNQQTWSPSTDFDSILKEYATKVGLDLKQFESDMNGMETKSRIDADKARGQALGFSSTPTVYVNGKMVPFQDLNVSKLKLVIDAELKAAAAKTPEPAPEKPISSDKETKESEKPAANDSKETKK
jgi:protein-disulfide isomerase